jgi:hypothetical protein
MIEFAIRSDENATPRGVMGGAGRCAPALGGLERSGD